MIEVNEKQEADARAVHVQPASPRMTRRRLLSSTGQITFLAMLPTACLPVINTPWADGTFWTDGQGWTD